MLKSATPLLAAPPGWVADAVGPGFRYVLAAGSQRPTPASMRTTDRPGSQAACGTRTSIWRRPGSTVAVGAGDSAAPDVASVSTAWSPCTVRKCCAGERTPEPKGQGAGSCELPRAIVNAVRSGS